MLLLASLEAVDTFGYVLMAVVVMVMVVVVCRLCGIS